MNNWLHTAVFSILLCSIFIFSQPKSANAAYMTSFDLLKLCYSKNSNDVELCYGYIAGIIDYHNLTRSLGTAPTIDFCVPAHIKLNDVAIRVANYLSTETQNDPFISSPAVALAFFNLFPCK